MIQSLLNAVVLGCTYSLIAIGLTMVYGILKILHVAHAGVYTLGAYVGLYSLYSFNSNFWIALVISMVTAGLFGVFIYRVIYFYILKESRIVPLISSIGLFIALMELFRLVAGPYQKAFPARLNFPGVKTSLFMLTSEQNLIITLTAIFLLALYFIINKTKSGLGWQACEQDIDMAGAMGVNVNRLVALNFFIGSALAGAAGVLMALYRNSVYPTMGAMVSYKAFVVVVLGGFGNVTGSITAGLLLAFIETLLGSWEWFEFPRDAIAFLVLVLVLMFKPKGLLGRG
jgi:branched-chain amino acid transport system permease protein